MRGDLSKGRAYLLRIARETFRGSRRAIRLWRMPFYDLRGRSGLAVARMRAVLEALGGFGWTLVRGRGGAKPDPPGVFRVLGRRSSSSADALCRWEAVMRIRPVAFARLVDAGMFGHCVEVGAVDPGC